MAQTNFTPILTYKSDTATSVPSASNLTNSTNGAELAVNTADKRLFTKDSGGNVVEVGTNPSSMTLPNGSANGVLYLNGSKVLTSGSALTFDGTNLGVGTSSPTQKLQVVGNVLASSGSWFGFGDADERISADNTGFMQFFVNASERIRIDSSGNVGVGTTTPTQKLQVVGNVLASSGGWFGFGDADERIVGDNSGFMQYFVSGSEQMRLTSTGLGIGTSSPSQKLTVAVADGVQAINLQGATGRLRVRPYVDATNGAILESTNTAENAYLPTTIIASTLRLFGNNATGATIDASGNLGLGVVPSAWSSTAFQVGSSSLFNTNNTAVISSNSYYNAAWKYINTTYAAQYDQYQGAHRFFTAPSGTAGTNISFTQAMTLDASGNLLLATTTPIYSSANRGNITIGGSSSSILVLGTGATTGGYVYFEQSTSSMELWNGANGYIRFGTNNAERARITSSGDLLVGTTGISGSASNTKYVSGGIFTTVIGQTASTASGTAVTLFTSPNEATFMVTAYIFGTGAPSSYNAVAIVKSSGGTAAITTISLATGMTISISGLNVQATQISGASQVIVYNALRIS